MVVKSVGERNVPTGTVALLFTDVESSVARWEKYPDAMREAIERHDMLLRSTIEAGGGYVFKTVGDAVCAAFSTASAAVAAAAQAQLDLQKEDWSAVGGLKVRMAIHTGPTDFRDGDYFGQTVNRVARLLSLAYGGQILVSGITKDLCEGMLPPPLSLRDEGVHRLRDLAHPEQIYQLLAPDLPSVFPALRSLEALPNNLPLQLTPFFGRETEVEQLEAGLAQHRLITLVGAGGVGKTRLSLQAGADLLDVFHDGVWFVDLAVRDSAQVPSAIAAAVNAEVEIGSDPLKTVTGTLGSKQLLLILDNCEHVIGEAARAAQAILQVCPTVRILATSRQALGISGEHVIRVPSLALPDPHVSIGAAQASKYGAIALFVDRAQAVMPSFTLTDENVETLVEICRRLDGIALAIELAAARLKLLSLHQLASRLNERFRLLTGGSRTALPRQQTMRALIDWSYDLLDEAERTVFRRSAVFTGSFSLEAVDSVCSSECGEWDSFDVLASLVDKSMITSELAGSEQRYRLLESAKEYALERFTQSGEDATIRERHAAYFLKLSAETERRYFTTPLRLWLPSLDPEVDNVHAALDWTMQQNRWIEAAAIASAFMWYWKHSRQLATPIELLRRILDHEDALDERLRARCYYALSYLLGQAGDEEAARTAGARAREIAQASGERESLAHALVAEASAAFMDFNYDGETAFQQAIDIFTECKNQRMVGMALGRRARSLGVRIRFDEASVFYERALAVARASGDDLTCAQVLNNLAEAAFNTGNPDLALRRAGEAVEYAAAARYESIVRGTYANMVIYLVHLGALDDALDRARMSLQLAREARSTIGISLLALQFAGIAAERGQLEEAAVLSGHYLAAFRRTYGSRDMEVTERDFYARTVAHLRARFDLQRLQELQGEGAGLETDDLVARMLSVV